VNGSDKAVVKGKEKEKRVKDKRPAEANEASTRLGLAM
jgi:hypothetical protein